MKHDRQGEPLELTLQRAFDRMEEPDPSRLEAILLRLENQIPAPRRRARNSHWLAWLLLAGGLATAAGYGLLRGAPDGPAAPPAPASTTHSATQPGGATGTPNADAPAAAGSDRRSIIIYRE